MMAEQVCRRFSLAEMQSATGDFSDARVIGRGGFGKVYKGLLDDDTLIVAVKRLASNSNQGAQEFAMEMETLSKLRHRNLVSLIGYCNEEGEMILVYEYMPNGTLADHLHKNNHNLTWNQRLTICIGAARALDYLHTGSSVIHRDFKPANILLDKNFTAKVSDFGLAKNLSADDLESHVSASVKGSFGYFDPFYFVSGRLTKASDTYAFGVVLLEILSGRKAIAGNLGEGEPCLTIWAQEKIRKGKFLDIVDSNLRAEISGDCLKTFVGVVKRCLHYEPKKRLSMTEAVAQLVIALEQQDRKGSSRKLQFPSFNPFWNRVTPSGIGSTETDNNEGEFNIQPQDALQGKVDYMEQIDALLREKVDYVRPQDGLLQSKVDEFRTKQNVRESFCVLAIQLAEMKNITDNFSSKSWISNGITGGSIFRGVLKTGKDVAIKRRYTKLPDKEFLEQVSISSSLKHENVMELLGYCVDGGLQVLVYEFSERGSLHDIFHGRQGLTALPMDPGPALSWTQRIEIAVAVAKGLLYLHDRSLIHGNIKSSNVLLFDNGIAKISDSHLSMKCPCERDRDWEESPDWNCGNHPPEYVIQIRSILNESKLIVFISVDRYAASGFSQEGDIYNFGVLLLELLTGRKSSDLTRNMPKQYIVDARLKGDYPQKIFAKMVQVAKCCIVPTAGDRPKMSNVLKALHIVAQS